ncbi:hypothetical protein VTI28DRAFT_4580 [Corynascus sepedonium]
MIRRRLPVLAPPGDHKCCHTTATPVAGPRHASFTRVALGIEYCPATRPPMNAQKQQNARAPKERERPPSSSYSVEEQWQVDERRKWTV